MAQTPLWLPDQLFHLESQDLFNVTGSAILYHFMACACSSIVNMVFYSKYSKMCFLSEACAQKQTQSPYGKLKGLRSNMQK